MAGDLLRELGSYPGLLWRVRRFQRTITPQKVAFGPHPDQYFLHFAPRERRFRAVVLYLHGGGWNGGSPDFFSPVGERLALEGYHCIMPGYRKAPEFKWPCQMEDVCAGWRVGLQYLAAHNIPADVALVVGSSAGAQLGALLCYDKKLRESHGSTACKLLGFAGLGGPYLFPEDGPWALKKLTDQLFEPGQERVSAQPYFSLEAGQTTPMLIIHSLRDAVVGYGCGDAFYRKARALGIPARLYIVSPRRDSHSVYTAGCFLEPRRTCPTVDTLLRWLEAL